MKTSLTLFKLWIVNFYQLITENLKPKSGRFSHLNKIISYESYYINKYPKSIHLFYQKIIIKNIYEHIIINSYCMKYYKTVHISRFF